MIKLLTKKQISLLTIFCAMAIVVSISYAKPYECKEGVGLIAYNKAYDTYENYLNFLFEDQYGCEKIDEFQDFAETDYPETGNVKRMCKNAGLNEAGEKVSNEKKLYCDTIDTIDGIVDGYVDGKLAAAEYCGKRISGDPYEDAYEWTCKKSMKFYAKKWCKDKMKNDPYFNFTVKQTCNL